MALFHFECSMLGEEICYLRLDSLRQQGASPVAQDLSERIGERPWLNQFGNVIVGHGISLLCWRSEVVKQPHDMPPSPIHAVTNFGP